MPAASKVATFPFTISGLTPYAHVQSVESSLPFYALLGLHAQFTHAGPDGSLVWANVNNGRAAIMLARASGPIDPSQQAVLFYLHTDDVAATRQALVAAGVPLCAATPPAPDLRPESVRQWGGGLASVGPLAHPFYMPKGELRLTDPDGYVILIGQQS